MKDKYKTKEQLINELADIGKQISELGAEYEAAKSLARFPNENPHPVLRVSKDGIIIYANRASKNLLNTLGCKVKQKLPDDLRKLTLDSLKSGMNKETQFVGERFIFSLIFVPVIEQGYVDIYGRDITERVLAEKELLKSHERLEKLVEERTSKLSNSIARLEREIFVRKEAEEELRKSREMFRSLVETTNDWVWEVDENAIYTYASPQIKEILGYEPEEIIGKTPFDLMPLEEAKRVGEIFGDIAASKRPFSSLENANIHKDGHMVVLDTSGVPVFDINGRFSGYRGIDRDITERKKADEDLRKSEARLADAQRIAHLGSWEWDIVKDELYWSDEVYRVFGLQHQEFGATYEAFLSSVHPEDREAVKKYVSEALYKNKPYGIDHRILLPDGTERTVHEQAEVAFDEAARAIRMIGTVQDITEKKRAEEDIQRNYHIQTVINALLNISLKNISLEEQIDQIIEQIVSIFWLTEESKGGIFLVDEASGGLVLMAHRGFSEGHISLCKRVKPKRCLCGRALVYGKIEFSGKADERHENRYDGMPSHGHYCVPIILGKKILGVLVLYLKEGHRRDVNEEEHLHVIANILAGIIQRKRTEEDMHKMEAQLLQAQKMEAVGQLAGGVAHDFNNLLTVIQGNTEMAIMRTGEDDPVFRNLKEIGRVTARASALTRQLLTFSRRQPMAKENLSVNNVVEEMLKMLQRLIGENISFRAELAPDLWNTKADPGQFEQLIMNLIVNARDAMPSGGKLLIKTDNTVIGEGITGEARPGRFVRISVEDTGTGMDAETRTRIFEPFFTTKGVGKGTGLGLSVVYGIVKSHDGWINVESEPGSGSNFKIYLPAVSGGVEERRNEDKRVDARGGNERILLVEDEKDIRELAVNMLERHGYRVISAPTYKDAVSVFMEESGNVDILVSDMLLPDHTGLELSKELRHHRPDLKVLFASGYSGEHLSQLENGDYRFLEKPYTLVDLLHAVREVLDKQA